MEPWIEPDRTPPWMELREPGSLPPPATNEIRRVPTFMMLYPHDVREFQIPRLLYDRCQDPVIPNHWVYIPQNGRTISCIHLTDVFGKKRMIIRGRKGGGLLLGICLVISIPSDTKGAQLTTGDIGPWRSTKMISGSNSKVERRSLLCRTRRTIREKNIN